jgi:flagellar motor switch protein FliG
MMSPEKKVATLMLFLGEERAAELLASLPKDVARRVLNAIGRLETVDETTVNQVVDEVLAIYRRQAQSTPSATSRKILEAASAALNDPTLFDDLEANFSVNEIRDDLSNIRADLIANWIRSEQPQVAAVVLSITSSDKGAEVFRLLPEAFQMQMCLAIAALHGVEAETIDLVRGEVKRLREIQSSEVSDLGGISTVTKLMQNLEPELRNRLLSQLEERSPDLTQQIRGQILSMELLAKLLPADLAKLCADLRDDEILLALRLEPEAVREGFLRGVSKNRREGLLDALANMRPQKRSNIDDARAIIVEKAITLHEKGVILFPWEDKIV